MKQTYEIILDEMATILSDLQEQASSMKETLLSVKISLEVLESSRPKHQAKMDALISVDGQEKHKLKQDITQKHADWTKEWSSQQSPLRHVANQSRIRTWYLG